jgi:hypothetical protein
VAARVQYIHSEREESERGIKRRTEKERDTNIANREREGRTQRDREKRQTVHRQTQQAW